MTFWEYAKQRFETDLTVGWDYAVNKICRLTNGEDKHINALCAVYNDGYIAAEGDDIDGGVCFIIREFAISQIQEYIEYKITGGDD